MIFVEPKHIRDWLYEKLSHPANGAQRHYLHALSELYRYTLDLHHALIATFLLTGGRRNEVLGLLGSDIDSENRPALTRKAPKLSFLRCLGILRAAATGYCRRTPPI